MVEVYSPWLSARASHAKRTPPETLGLSDYALTHFVLPQRYVMDEAAHIVRAMRQAEADGERIARERLEEHMDQNDGAVVTTAADVKAKRVDLPKRGKFALLPKDERERKRPNTPVYMDTTPGETPMYVVGGPGEHWQDLRDQVDESRHYGLDNQKLRDDPDLNALHYRAAERGERRRKGQTAGYARLDKDGRPVFKGE